MKTPLKKEELKTLASLLKRACECEQIEVTTNEEGGEVAAGSHLTNADVEETNEGGVSLFVPFETIAFLHSKTK